MLQLCVYRSKMLSTIYRNMYIYISIYLSIYVFNIDLCVNLLYMSMVWLTQAHTTTCPNGALVRFSAPIDLEKMLKSANPANLAKQSMFERRFERSTEVQCSKAIDNSISRMMFCSILQVWVALLSTSNILVWYSNGRCYRLQYCKIETACLVLFVWISSPMVGKSSVATRLHNRLGTRNCCIKSAKSVQCSHRMEKNHKD